MRLGNQILEHLQALSDATGFITGACVGGDAFIGRTLFEIFPDHQHTVVIPADRSRVDPWWERHVHYFSGGMGGVHNAPWIRVIHMAVDTTYQNRNQTLVNFSDALIGYPLYNERDARSRRSGSWQTIRMAHRQHSVRPLVYPVGAMA